MYDASDLQEKPAKVFILTRVSLGYRAEASRNFHPSQRMADSDGKT